MASIKCTTSLLPVSSKGGGRKIRRRRRRRRRPSHLLLSIPHPHRLGEEFAFSFLLSHFFSLPLPLRSVVRETADDCDEHTSLRWRKRGREMKSKRFSPATHDYTHANLVWPSRLLNQMLFQVSTRVTGLGGYFEGEKRRRR